MRSIPSGEARTRRLPSYPRTSVPRFSRPPRRCATRPSLSPTARWYANCARSPRVGPSSRREPMTTTNQGTKVTITYCAECGYEPQTLALTEALMKAFTHQLTAIELLPWYEGSFDVAVNRE